MQVSLRRYFFVTTFPVSFGLNLKSTVLFSTTQHHSQVTSEVPYGSENFFHYEIQMKGAVFSSSWNMLCISFVQMQLAHLSLRAFLVQLSDTRTGTKRTLSLPQEWHCTWHLASNDIKALESKDWRWPILLLLLKILSQKYLLTGRLSADIFTVSGISSTQSL